MFLSINLSLIRPPIHPPNRFEHLVNHHHSHQEEYPVVHYRDVEVIHLVEFLVVASLSFSEFPPLRLPLLLLSSSSAFPPDIVIHPSCVPDPHSLFVGFGF